MAAITDPNLGLEFGFDYGESPWNQSLDRNLVILGGMVSLSVKSKTTTAQPAASDGDVYFVPVGATGADWSGQDSSIAVYSAQNTKDINNNPVPIGWSFIPVKTGWHFTVQDESNALVVWNGATIVDAVDTSNLVTPSDNVQFTGTVEFTNTATFTGSHGADPNELATMGDVDADIATQHTADQAEFVGLTNSQTISGVKSFTGIGNSFSETVSGVSAIASTDLAILQDVTDAIDGISISNLGGFSEIAVQNLTGTLEFRTLQSNDGSVSIVQNANDIDLTVSLPPSVAAFNDLTDTPANFIGAAEQFVRVNTNEDALEYVTLPTQAVAYTDLTDVDTTYAGQQGKYVGVNVAEDGLVFITPPALQTATFKDLTDTPAAIPADVRHYLHANAAGDELEYSLLDTSLITNVSSLTGITLSDALNGIGSDDIANESGITGATVTAAFNTIDTAIDNLTAQVQTASVSIEDESTPVGTFATVNFIGATVTNQGESVDVSLPIPAADFILYTPSGLDSISAHDTVPEDASPYLANSFEEAVTKSKAAGRLPIVVDADVRELSGSTTACPRIKSFNVGSVSYYDLTNILIYSRDAWLRKEYETLEATDDSENLFVVDQGVTLRYNNEPSSNQTDYQDDYNSGVLNQGGRQVHGFIGFGKFRPTNQVHTVDLPDALNHTKVTDFIELYSPASLFAEKSISSFMLWADEINYTSNVPTAEEPYTNNFIKIIPQAINSTNGDPTPSEILVDIQSRKILSTGGTMAVEIAEGTFNNSFNTDIEVHFRFKGKNPQEIVFDYRIYEGQNTAYLNAETTLNLDLTISETKPLQLTFEPVDNSIINLLSADTNSPSISAGIWKYGIGRLHFTSLVDVYNVTVYSYSDRPHSGVTSTGTFSKFNVQHSDTTGSGDISSTTFESYTAAGDISLTDGSGSNLTISASGTAVDNLTSTGFVDEGRALFIASAVQTQGEQILTSSGAVQANNPNDVVTLPQGVNGRIISIVNAAQNPVQIYPYSGENLGSGVDTPITIEYLEQFTYIYLDFLGQWKNYYTLFQDDSLKHTGFIAHGAQSVTAYNPPTQDQEILTRPWVRVFANNDGDSVTLPDLDATVFRNREDGTSNSYEISIELYVRNESGNGNTVAIYPPTGFEIKKEGTQTLGFGNPYILADGQIAVFRKYFSGGTYQLVSDQATLIDSDVKFNSIETNYSAVTPVLLTAAGATQVTAEPIVSGFSSVGGVVDGVTDGVRLPSSSGIKVGAIYNVVHSGTGGTTLKIYPASGEMIDLGGGADLPISITRGSNANSPTEATLMYFGGGMWVVLNNQSVMVNSDVSFNAINCDTFIRGSVNSGVTASATQSQGQEPLVAEYNIVTTVGTSGDVVTLPTAEEGKRILIRNSGGNTLTIYPASGDDLGTGVNTPTTLANNLEVEFFCLDATTWVDNRSLNTSTGTLTASNANISSLSVTGSIVVQNNALMVDSVDPAVTASVTQTQGQETVTANIVEVTTVANLNDVITLPVSSRGTSILVVNDGANTLQIFPNTGDEIDGGGANNSVTLAAGAHARYTKYASTKWVTE